MFTCTFKLVSRVPEAKRNLQAGVDEAVRTQAENAKSICVQLTPRSNNDAPGHVHTQDTVHVARLGPAHYALRAAGAMRFLEFGTMYYAALAPMRTSLNSVKPKLLEALKRMKVLK
jgi:hypothetical protein